GLTGAATCGSRRAARGDEAPRGRPRLQTTPGGPTQMSEAIRFEVLLGDTLPCRGQAGLAGDHRALQFQETDLGRVLIADVPGQKGIVGYGKHEVVGGDVDLRHAERVLA